MDDKRLDHVELLAAIITAGQLQRIAEGTPITWDDIFTVTCRQLAEITEPSSEPGGPPTRPWQA